jgi:hypothetical protein
MQKLLQEEISDLEILGLFNYAVCLFLLFMNCLLNVAVNARMSCI